jgi:activator of HSP90 ATPase
LAACGVEAARAAHAQAMQHIGAADENRMRTSLHQEVVLKASPARIYDILLSSKLFAAFSGSPAEIDPSAGGAFSMFDGQIAGRNVELVPAQRIVQAWRPAHWDQGVYSIVRFDLSPRDATCSVVLDHYGFPQGEYDHLSRGWKAHYWDRLEKFLA